MSRRLLPGARTATTAVAVALLAIAATGCGSTTKAASHTVDVLMAGSLQNVIEDQIGPTFESSSGDTLHPYAAGSSAVANAIKGKVQVGDVFLSAVATVDKTLEGKSNGSWVSWYSTFGTTRLVIGYNPHSKFAADFKTKPWYQVLSLPGIRVGRTDPATDPKGVLALTALSEATRLYHDPTLSKKVLANSTVFAEQEMVGRLQAGQLDAGFFYTAEAVPAHIPSVSMGAVRLHAAYTLTVLNGAPDPSAAAAFVRYLLGPGRTKLSKDGITPVTPTLTGPASAVPASLRSIVGG